MYRVLFVCHGNICRSPMAEFLLKDYVKKLKKEDHFYIESAATSSEEIGNPVHSGTKRILNSLGIDCSLKVARKINSEEKIYALLDFANQKRDIRDPWYTGDFKETYEDILMGIEAFLHFLGII